MRSTFRIADGNQTELIHIPKKKLNWIEEIISAYPWDDYNEYDNRLTEYQYGLFDDMIDDMEEDLEEEELWLQLTKGQKIFYTYLLFEGDMDNGGLFQFFWNNADHQYSMLDVMQELQLEELEEDYLFHLNKYTSVENEILALQNLQSDSDDDLIIEHYHKAFHLFGGESKIESYFYTTAFKLSLNRAMAEYIENHLDQFIGK